MMNLNVKHIGFVFFCALFNLLFEYSARGVHEFIQRPLFVFALFGIYFTYFLMLEDLILRYRLTNYHLFLVAFLYGLFPTAFLTGNLFNRDIYWGIIYGDINWGTIVIVGILAWGVLQGIVTLYLANRLTPRDWNHPKLGPVGWALSILYQLVIMGIASTNTRTPRGTPMGFILSSILILVILLLLAQSVRTSRREFLPFETSRVMDILAFGSVIIFLALGTFLAFGPTIVTSQPLNTYAVKLENLWVIFCGIVFFTYRFWKKADVRI